MNDLEWTGERLVTSINNVNGVFEHLHRYALAQFYVENKVVLDIASGEGYGSFLLSQKAKTVIGVDVDERSIDHSRNKYESAGNLSFIVGNGESIPIQSKYFDVVVSFETIEHLKDQENFIKEIRRVLKDDGILIISSPEKSIYYERDPDNPFHINELTKVEFHDLISRYFNNILPFVQRYFLGSIIHLVDGDKSRGINFFSGNFDKINHELNDHILYNRAYFNIIFASNSIIDPLMFSTSFFSGFEPIESELIFLRSKLNSILKSKSYRLFIKIVQFLKFRF